MDVLPKIDLIGHVISVGSLQFLLNVSQTIHQMLLFLRCQLLHPAVVGMAPDVEVAEIGVHVVLNTDLIGREPGLSG